MLVLLIPGYPMTKPTPGRAPQRRPRPVCFLCRKPIARKVYYQGNVSTLPVHGRCRIVIKRSEDGGV